jgi:TPR repeat protein
MRAAALMAIMAAGPPPVAAGLAHDDLPQENALEQLEKPLHALLSGDAASAEQAVALYRRYADRHNAFAEFDLAYCYELGFGVQQDRQAAEALYQRAARDAADPSLRAAAAAAQQDMARQIRLNEFVTSGP